MCHRKIMQIYFEFVSLRSVPASGFVGSNLACMLGLHLHLPWQDLARISWPL